MKLTSSTVIAWCSVILTSIGIPTGVLAGTTAYTAEAVTGALVIVHIAEYWRTQRHDSRLAAGIRTLTSNPELAKVFTAVTYGDVGKIIADAHRLVEALPGLGAATPATSPNYRLASQVHGVPLEGPVKP